MVEKSRTAEQLDALRRGDFEALGQSREHVERARALLDSDDPRDAESLPEPLLQLIAHDAAERRREPFLLAASDGPKALAKLVKKELYRLRSEGRGIELAKPVAQASKSSASEESLSAFLSPVDIDGRRTFIAPHQGPRGFEGVLGELSDVLGVVRVEVAPMPRREYRKFARELSRPRGDEPVWLELVPARFGSFVASAANIPTSDSEAQRGAAMLSKMFPGTPEPAASRSWPALDANAERTCVLEGAKIFSHVENLRWLPSTDALRMLAHRIDEVATSKIVVDEAQRRQQLEAALDRCVAEYFDTSTRALWAERLFRQADHFEATHRHEPAQLLAANARALASDAPVSEIPFTRMIFQKALFEQTQAALERLTPEQRDRLLAEERAGEAAPGASPLIVPGR